MCPVQGKLRAESSSLIVSDRDIPWLGRVWSENQDVYKHALNGTPVPAEHALPPGGRSKSRRRNCAVIRQDVGSHVCGECRAPSSPPQQRHGFVALA